MPLVPLPTLRSLMVSVAHRLHENGWVANHDGNASVRLKGERLLMTCSGISKREVEDSSLLIVDFEGKVLEGRGRPFSELDLHLAAYQARPDVDAVLHAHPPFATAYGLAELELQPISLPEMIVSLGDRVPTVPRSMPKDPEGARRVTAEAAKCDAMLLSGNGALTLGSDLTQALLRMELIEHYAKILQIASSLGTVRPLAQSEVEGLLQARKKAGLGPRQ